MMTVNMLEAKTQLSKLVEAVESGAEAEVIIARNGKPAAKLVPIDAGEAEEAADGLPRRASSLDMSLEDFNANDDEIAAMFFGDDA